MSILMAGAMSLLLTVRNSDAPHQSQRCWAWRSHARAGRAAITRLGVVAVRSRGGHGTARDRHSSLPRRTTAECLPWFDVGALMILALGLVVYGRHVRSTLDKLQALKAALDVDGMHNGRAR
jgi:hypothetical protein